MYCVFSVNRLRFVVTLNKMHHKLNDVAEEAHKTLY